MREPRPVAEHRHEGEQIERERQHPQERRGRDIGRDVGGHRDHEAGRDRGEHDPRETVAPCGARRSDGAHLGRPAPRAAISRRRRPAARSAGKADRPDPGLSAQGQQRLDRERIGEQRRERAEVRGGIEHVRVARLRVAAGGEPALQQRRARRQRGERQADRGREQADQPQPDAARRRRAKPCAMPIGRVSAASGKHAEMDQRALPDLERAREQMRIGIADQQRGLEEHHRDRPHRGRAAEPRQHHLGEHRLHGEQQQRRGKTASRQKARA